MKNTKLYLFSVIAIVIALGLVSCGPPKVKPEQAGNCVPSNLIVETNDGVMNLSWNTNCKQLISGYYIYISDEPIVEKYPTSVLPSSVKAFNNTVFPGDTERDDQVEHYIANGLDNARRYHVSVRTVFPDRTLSAPSDEIIAVCGPKGQIELGVRYRSNQDGFSFLTQDYVAAKNVANDLCFYSQNGVDYLESPSRLDMFLRGTRLRLLPFHGDLNEIQKQLSEMKTRAFEDRINIKKGDWVWLTFPEGYHALLHVLDITGQEKDRRISLFYAFSQFEKPVF